MKNIIEMLHLTHTFKEYDEEDNEIGQHDAVKDVSLSIEEGSFVAILGHNGSGKSTLAKHVNALLLPTEGTVMVSGRSTANEDDLYKVRQDAGMIFQNPDNQIIGNIVEEDVGFGPENMGVPTEDIWKRVDFALERAGMQAFRLKSPNRLSGGQKQRVAIAGVLAMKPKCILMDEPTAMLDPIGRQEVLRTVKELNKQEKITLVLITHYMEEVTDADRVIVMDDGKIVMDGKPKDIFGRVDELRDYHLDVPQVTRLAFELKKEGLKIPDGVLEREELVDELTKLYQGMQERADLKAAEKTSKKTLEKTLEKTSETASVSDTGLTLDHVSFIYDPDQRVVQKALDDVSLHIDRGEFIGLIGHTGSGKSTMIQFMNGLLKPTEGRVFFDGRDIAEKDYPLRELRTKVGLVFQYPEHQLFETEVIKDISFGPKNMKLPEEEIQRRARMAMNLVGLDESYDKKSPFDLSGGQKRRVAIAGVLAMEPDFLILDEPTAGLDPEGRDEILDCVKQLNKEKGITIILVTHSMEDAARYADRLIVMSGGKKQMDGEPREIFKKYKELEQMGLSAPQVTYIAHDLKAKGLPVDETVMTVEEAKNTILRALCK